MVDKESSGSSDENLDARSETFNPMKALYSTKIQHSASYGSSAPIYDNVSKFESVMKSASTRTATKKKDSGIQRAQVQEFAKERFLPHQELTSRKKNEDAGNERGKNVFSKMQSAHGPLGMLYQYMQRRVRIRVYTRNARGIRGYVEAYVAAFDKHWNLALEDCFEIWSRKLKRKAPVFGAKIEVNTERVGPEVAVKKCEGKTETLERHVPQMLLRGEHVVIIAKIN